ncbi:MAG TPA: aminodeoxychorismate synthase component I [Gammaproteobacteria bacterium]|nr:aminodeoxychorismate synthase component I [Gammaproteobacteria bacterium]
MLPLVKEIAWIDPVTVFGQVAHEPGSIFLDSALQPSSLGKYSFIALDPFESLESIKDISRRSKEKTNNPFDLMQNILREYPQKLLPHLPPFQGGMAGFLGYSLCRYLENLPSHQFDDMEFAPFYVGLYDLVMGFDLISKKVYLFSSGYPEKEEKKREARAKARLEALMKILDKVQPLPNIPKIYIKPEAIETNFTKFQYFAAVQKTIDYIYAGDIFEANISQRFKANLPEGLSPFDLYRRVRSQNPGAFAAYLNSPDCVIASVSPERFLKLDQNEVETRPIKGTIPRGKNSNEDSVLAKRLLESEKDRAENIMIVDLMRNDLSRVCKPYTVEVPKLCALERFSTVHHLVSVVKGELKPEYNAIDLLKATFPGGSITGAPKIRSMEIIAEIEPTERGPYCGSLGYIGFNGQMDMNILIRSYCIKGNTVTFQAGGAVVSDSIPINEYQESLAKAQALQNCLTQECDSL